MSAIIILLPSDGWNDCPSDCEPVADHQRERVVDLRDFLGGRPPRGRPHLVYSRTRIVTDDDMAASLEHHDR